MSKWFNPKFIAPPIDLRFIAYVEEIYVFDSMLADQIPLKFPVQKIIVAVLSKNEFITDLFSLYEKKPVVLKLNSLLLWQKMPKRPKYVEKL